MIPLRTERLILRNWEKTDRTLFRRINSDERVMEFFPFRRSQEEADSFLEVLTADIADQGYGFAAAEITATSQTIGFVGISDVTLPPSLVPARIEIGWRLAPEFWGNGYVTEAAHAWLDFAFDKLHAPHVASFAVEHNKRSLAVMKRLGMHSDTDRDFDHPAVPDSHPHLKRHRLYGISRKQWDQAKSVERSHA